MRTIKLIGQFLAGQDKTVGRMCWVSPDLAGKRLSTEVSGHTVHLHFPPRPAEATAQDGYNGRMGDDPTNPAGVAPSHFFAELDWVVEDQDTRTESQNLEEAVEVLKAGATRLTDGLRIAQPVIGLAGDSPQALTLSAVDTATGENLSLGTPLNKSSPMAVGYPVVDAEMVAHALAGDLDVPEILLAQSAYWTLWTPNPKPGLGVLLVAMACESKARRVLMQRVSKEMEPLLTILFDKPRVFQQPAHDLFDNVADAVLGKSLRRDDDALWKQVVKTFELRNKMAHRGSEPTRSQAGPLVAAGYKVFEWLRSDLG
jgi:hypothetical protein